VHRDGSEYDCQQRSANESHRVWVVDVEVDVVVVDVPAGIVPVVPVDPLPEALPAALVSVALVLLVTGGPPPVSVAVVAVVADWVG
jgi:hypothetical protein